jgi:hypothetical protein
MPRNDGKLEPGQKLNGAITARSWNRMVDATEIVLGSPRDFGADGVQGPPAPNHTILCRNDSGAAVGRWGVLAITGMVISPSGATGAALLSWQTSPAVIGVSPPTGAGAGFVVAVEPIAAGKLGQAAVAGVVQAKINVSDANHTFATPRPGSTTEFDSASSGPAFILWKDGGTGSGKWALLRIGAGGGGTRLGKISASWAKGSTAAVAEYDGSGTAKGTTFSAVNRFGLVTGPTSGSPQWVACSLVDSTWHLIAAECV